MTQEQDTFVKGYDEMLTNLEEMINASIQLNNNARTPEDILNVLNTVIRFTNECRTELNEVLRVQDAPSLLN
jgi:hypothetical protein